MLVIEVIRSIGIQRPQCRPAYLKMLYTWTVSCVREV